MPRVVDRQAQRDSLLRGAFPVFARLGYGSVTMRDLASELGVSTGTLYHYFPSKDDLFRAAFEQVSAADVAEALAELPPDAPADAHLAALRGYVQRRADHLRQVVLVALEFWRQHPDPDARDFLAQRVGVYRAAVRSRLGGVGGGDLWFAAIIGGLVLGLVEPDAADLEQLWASPP